MNKYATPIIFLLVSIGLVFGSVALAKKSVLKGPKNSAECESKVNVPSSCQKDANCCGIWDDNMCRKGVINQNGVCESKGSVLPLLLLVFGGLFFLGFIYKLVSAIRQKE